MRSIPVSRLLMNIASDQNVKFMLGDRAVDPLWVFDAAAYLPVVAYCAESLAQETVGWSIGVQLRKDPDSVFGLRVAPQVVRAENHFQGTLTGLMYLRGADICFGWKQNQIVDLKKVYDRMSTLIGPLFEDASESLVEGDK